MFSNANIYYSCNSYPTYYESIPISRWDEGNWDVVIEFFCESGTRNNIFHNLVPGAVTEQYNILGTPTYVDLTYESGNSLIIDPIDGYGLSGLRSRRTIAVKNISDTFINQNYFKVKIEGYRL